jgi:hypothetical protein
VSDNKASFALAANLEIAGHDFTGIIGYVEVEGVAVSARWISNDQELTFLSLAESLGFNYMPSIGMLEAQLVGAEFTYHDNSKCVTISVELEPAKITLKGSNGSFGLQLIFAGENGETFSLSDLPILGSMLSSNDYIQLKKLAVTCENGKSSFNAVGKFSFLNSEISFESDKNPTTISSSTDANPTTTSLSTDVNESKDGIKWIEINKTISIIRLGRVGVAFKDGKVNIYIDGGFSVSLLTADFLGLRLGIPIPIEGGTFDFGLSGLLISLNKPPISITGGLYKVPEDAVLYNGMLNLKFNDFNIAAIGSYGEITDKETGEKSPSLFIYAALLTPLGGPGCFYITGIALGFGINRTIKMPSLHDVPKFPLVQLVMGTGSLKADDESSQALAALSDHIKPSQDDYFAAIGVKFTSYSIATSFALLVVEFGNKLRISLLGQSVITMPPNLPKDKKPIMYAELALRAILDFDVGYFEVMAALTNESYILDGRCKLTGGFVFAMWTKGDRAGDFIISLGGCHHPLFASKKHLYPSADKLGINWAINDNLTLKGQGYFAVTHSCVMAGCDIAINYCADNLKAWLNAYASFYMLWKPLHYDIRVGIKIGVSYTIKIWFIKATIKVELGASLHLWGPEFSGTATINLYLFSFTIKFGANALQSPPPINWNEFRQSFLPKELPQEHGQKMLGEGAPTCRIQFTDGILSEGRDVKDNNTVFISPQEFRIVIRTDIPSTSVKFQGITVKSNSQFGIAPMHLTEVGCEQTIVIRTTNGSGELNQGAFEHVLLCENVSAALWGKNPGPISDPIKNQIIGMEIRIKPLNLSESFSTYNIKDLAELILREGKGWGKDDVISEPKEPKYMDKPDKEKLEKQVKQLNEIFEHLLPEPRYAENGIYDAPMDYFWATPQIRETGVKYSAQRN